MELTNSQIEELYREEELDPKLNMFDKTKIPVWEQGQLGGRIRPINQDVLFKNFCEVTDILTKHKVRYSTSHGTLLGLVRLESLIPWDDDIDITLFVEDMPKMLKVEEELRSLGYWVPVRTDNPKDKVNKLEKMWWYDFNAIKDGEKIEGWFTEKIGTKYVYDQPRVGLAWPEKYFDTLSTVKWGEKEFSAPNDIEGYLDRMYPGKRPIEFQSRGTKYRHST